MSAEQSPELIQSLLTEGLDDWVYEAWVYQVARATGCTNPADLRAISIGLIVELLTHGLMIAGDYDGERHRPWSESVPAAIDRIVNAWIAWGDTPPTPGSIVWLALTPKGRVRQGASAQGEKSRGADARI
jgi:hypothetical protein